MNILENVELAPLTTFEIGGPAKYFIEVKNSDQLGAALDYAQTRKLPFFVLAGGSNVLIADTGFNGVVIKIAFKKLKVDTLNSQVYAEAGSSLMDCIFESAGAGLSGMESMYGIPGSVGGAARGNAGAFGAEMVDVVKEITALNIETREIKTFANEDCFFSYRNSFFKKNTDWIIISVLLQLEKETGGSALKRAEEILALRNERQIQNIQSAGSFFMNPSVNQSIQDSFRKEKGTEARERRVPAGWLIEKSGFKGVCENNVCTGKRSPNYIINSGGASASSVRNLAESIRNKVLEKFAIELHEEVMQVGF